MFKILKNIKNVFVHIRSSLKIILMVIIAAILIIGIISIFYKPTYAVTLNGEFIGYTNDKNALQAELNEYMHGREEENIAFIDIQTLPEYSLCFVKKDNVDSTEEIVEQVKSLGTTYYEYYAILLEEQEKFYVATRDDAEEIIDTLKDKDSNNIDEISYTQIYDTELEEYTDNETVIDELYEKRKVYVYTGYYTIATAKIELGIDLIKPVQSGYTITSRFGPRNSGMHKGLDVAAPIGTPIYAAAEGTVTTAGWSDTGYGYCIEITHNNGVKTLYAHCSELYVSAGDYVSQGQHIAAVGSTGWSTGPHLHLEIRVNGSVVNPQYYLY